MRSPLTLRVADDVRARWEQAAADEGCKLSEWIRRACEHRATVAVVLPTVLPPRVSRLRSTPGDLAGPAKPDPRKP